MKYHHGESPHTTQIKLANKSLMLELIIHSKHEYNPYKHAYTVLNEIVS